MFRSSRVQQPSRPSIDFAPVAHLLVPYRRVSTREQADKGAGLAAQRTSIDLGSRMRDKQILTWDCVDKGKSGKDMNRPGLSTALQIVEQGQAGGIIVSKLDRLSRSLLDFARLMERADKNGWNIVALDLGIDLSTPEGKMMASIMAVFAEWERNRIIQRTNEGLAEKRAEGVRFGRKPVIESNLLVAIAGMYQLEGNFSAVSRWLNEAGTPTVHGGKQWYPATVQKLLNSQEGKAVMGQWDTVDAG